MTDLQAESITTSDRVDVLGIHVSVTNLDHTVGAFAGWIERGERQLVCVTDMNALLHARADARLTEVYNTSGLTVPDGMPLVWAGQRAGFEEMDRVAGPDLLERVLAEAADRGWTQYFYGGAEGVAEELRERFQERHPALKVVGVECPPYRALTDAEDAETVARMNEARPDIVWVGLGAPKQERWMADHRDRLNATILIGVGAAFDFHTGRLDRATTTPTARLLRLDSAWSAKPQLARPAGPASRRSFGRRNFTNAL